VPVPEAGSVDPFALAVAAAAFVALQRFRANPAPVALACGLAGLIRALAA
jgi:hypothetical protein